MDMKLMKLWEIVKDRGGRQAAVCGSQSVGHNLVIEQKQQQNWKIDYFHCRNWFKKDIRENNKIISMEFALDQKITFHRQWIKEEIREQEAEEHLMTEKF